MGRKKLKAYLEVQEDNSPRPLFECFVCGKHEEVSKSRGYHIIGHYKATDGGGRWPNIMVCNDCYFKRGIKHTDDMICTECHQPLSPDCYEIVDDGILCTYCMYGGE